MHPRKGATSTFRSIPFPMLETERLVLRQLQLTDQHEMFRLRSEIEVNRYIPRLAFHHVSEATDFILKINEGIQMRRWLYWGIRKKESARILGTICLWNFNPIESVADVGYEMLPEYFGNGYMHEALNVIIRHAKQLKLKSIDAHTFSNNIRSVRLLERNNFRLGIEPDDTMRLNEVVYTLVLT